MKADGQPFRLDMREGDTVELPDGLGSVTFEGIERWNKIQISRTPGKLVALTGVVLALVGLLGSLFIRPRRVWVRTRRSRERRDRRRPRRPRSQQRWRPGARRARARGDHGVAAHPWKGQSVTNASWEALSNQAVAASGVVYFLALLAHLVQWAGLRKLPADEAVTTGRTAMAGRLGVLLTVIAVGVHVRRARRARDGRGPQPGAVGKHVRVHARRDVLRRTALPASSCAASRSSGWGRSWSPSSSR